MTLLTFSLNLDFSGLEAAVTGFLMMGAAAILLLVSLLVGMIVRHQHSIPLFKQRSGAVLIGSFVLLTLGAGLFLPVTEMFETTKEFRRSMDGICFFWAVFSAIATIFVIMMRMAKAQKAGHKKSQGISV